MFRPLLKDIINTTVKFVNNILLNLKTNYQYELV